MSLRGRLERLRRRTEALVSAQGTTSQCPACHGPAHGVVGTRVLHIDENGVERKRGFLARGGKDPRFCLECGRLVHESTQGPFCSLPGQWPSDVGEGPIFRVMARVPER